MIPPNARANPDKSYQVFWNVNDFGTKGDSLIDDQVCNPQKIKFVLVLCSYMLWQSHVLRWTTWWWSNFVKFINVCLAFVVVVVN